MDKVSLEESFIGQSTGKRTAGTPELGTGTARNEAVEALTALGYSPSEAMRAVKKAGANADALEGMDTEDILRLALKYING